MLLRGLMVHVKSVANALGKSGASDILQESKNDSAETWVKEAFRRLMVNAFHNVKVHPQHDGKIDYEFLIDQHGYLGWMLVSNQQFMETYGFSNDWMRMSKDDMRDFALNNKLSKRTPKVDRDNAFMLKFTFIRWLNEVFKEIAMAHRRVSPVINTKWK